MDDKIQRVREMSEYAARIGLSGIMVPADDLAELIVEYDRLKSANKQLIGAMLHMKG